MRPASVGSAVTPLVAGATVIRAAPAAAGGAAAVTPVPPPPLSPAGCVETMAVDRWWSLETGCALRGLCARVLQGGRACGAGAREHATSVSRLRHPAAKHPRYTRRLIPARHAARGACTYVVKSEGSRGAGG
ncbi:hypothetical protein EON68_00890 [archaeon]|nr:MAG: hypothetical protein EON68_00890 [archaeon]